MNSDHEIQQKLQELAKRRRKGLVALLAGAVCPFLLILMREGGAWWITVLITLDILATIFLIIYGFIVWADASGRLKDIISDAFMPGALSMAFEHVEYHQERHIPEGDIDALVIQHGWEDTGGNDFVRANYRGFPVEFSDIRLTYESGTGKDRRTRTAFSGLYAICSFEKGFPAELRLIGHKKFRLFKMKPPDNMFAMTSGYEALDEQLRLFSDDPQSAQAILTSQAVKNILRLYEYTGGQCNLKLTRDGKAHIAVDSGHNLFEPGKRIEEAEQLIAEELRYVTDIIDMLLGAFAADGL